jgi:cobalt-zinc-cadmium efflux system outer membrane protein
LVIVALSIIVLCAVAVPARADTSLPASGFSEADAVARGLALAPFRDVEQGDIARSRVREAAERRWSNPVVAYSREDAGDTTEHLASVSQELTLSGRRGLRAAAAGRRTAAAEDRSRRSLQERAADIRTAYYSVLAAQERITAARTWVERLREAERAAARREAAGDVSTYDHRRVARELYRAETTESRERAALEEAWSVLAPKIELAPAADGSWPLLTGTLLPDSDLPSLEVALEGLDRRGDLGAIENEIRAAGLYGEAAGRGWIPPVTIGAGPKFVDSDGASDSGFVVTASVPLPVFNRDQAEQMRAVADVRAARGRAALLRAEAEAQLRGAWRNAGQLEAAARELAARTEAASPALIRAAEAAYQGGEIGVLEILDAYRTGFEDRLQRIELEVEARRARIAVDLAGAGGFD